MVLRERLAMYGLPAMGVLSGVSGLVSGDAGFLALSVLTILMWGMVIMMRPRREAGDNDSHVV